jgi:hypothetical protein
MIYSLLKAFKKKLTFQQFFFGKLPFIQNKPTRLFFHPLPIFKIIYLPVPE